MGKTSWLSFPPPISCYFFEFVVNPSSSIPPPINNDPPTHTRGVIESTSCFGGRFFLPSTCSRGRGRRRFSHLLDLEIRHAQPTSGKKNQQKTLKRHLFFSTSSELTTTTSFVPLFSPPRLSRVGWLVHVAAHHDELPVRQRRHADQRHQHAVQGGGGLTSRTQMTRSA
jgi:hypothetical protein